MTISNPNIPTPGTPPPAPNDNAQSGSPEGARVGSPGEVYVDIDTNQVWVKKGDVGKYGWIQAPGGSGGEAPPSGTGFVHITSSAQDPAAVSETGSGAVVRTGTPTITSPILVTPTIGSLTNAQHSHQDAAGGGLLDVAAIGSGTLPTARGGTGTTVTTGSGSLVLATSPTIVTPTIASLTNAQHNHQNSAGGGLLDVAAIGSGVFPIARLATGTPTGSKFLRDDGSLATPPGGGTVNETWYNAVTGFGLDNTGVSDCTAALQTAINTLLGGANASTAVNVTIFFPTGTYLFSSAPTNFTDGAENTIIAVPVKSNVTGGGSTIWSRINFRGESCPSYWCGSNTGGTITKSGTIFRVTSAAGSGGFIKSDKSSLGVGNFNWNQIHFQNIWFDTIEQTNLTVLDLNLFVGASIWECTFTSTKGGSAMLTPSNNSVAINMPQTASGDYNQLRNVSVEGYWKAIRVGEHVTAYHLNIGSCKNGLCLKASNYGVKIDYMWTGNCVVAILGEATSKNVIINCWDIEDGATDWRAATANFSDSNGTTGIIWWHKQDNTTAANATKLFVSSGENVTFIHQDTGFWTSLSTAGLGLRGVGGQRFSATAVGPNFTLRKARGTFASPAAVSSGDFAGLFCFQLHDGTTFNTFAWMAALATATGTSGNTAGKIQFSVGSSTSAAAILEIASTGITLLDNNFIVGTTTGTKFGTATTQKLSFYNATPIVQPAGANQAALTDSTGGTPAFTLVDVGVAFSQTNVNNNFASIARMLNQMRTDLVALGLQKGAA